MGLFQFPTKNEEKYERRLVALKFSLVAYWADCKDFDFRSMCFAKPQLCADSHSLEKVNLQYRSSFVRREL